MNKKTENRIELINRYKKQKNAFIMAHNFQPKEIHRAADFTGDFYELSKKSLEIEAEAILICGVNCMAETIKILSPDKEVLTPELFASCPLAVMADIHELRDIKSKHPDAAVVSYINSTTELKAESDICCSSSNALEIIESLEQEKIIFIPDKHLGDYIDRRTDKDIISYGGYCPIHHRVNLHDLEKMRKKYPGAEILVHPTCKPEIRKKADFVGSVEKMLAYVQDTDSEEFLIGTEMGIIYRFKRENPEKKFYLLSPFLNCQNMKRNKVDKILNSLQNDEVEVKVNADIRERAEIPLKRMFNILES